MTRPYVTQNGIDAYEIFDDRHSPQKMGAPAERNYEAVFDLLDDPNRLVKIIDSYPGNHRSFFSGVNQRDLSAMQMACVLRMHTEGLVEYKFGKFVFTEKGKDNCEQF